MRWADEGRVVDGREVVLFATRRDEQVERRRFCVEEEVELDISLCDILDCLTVVLYVLLGLLVMRSRHLDAEVAVRFIVALVVSSRFQFSSSLICLYC